MDLCSVAGGQRMAAVFFVSLCVAACAAGADGAPKPGASAPTESGKADAGKPDAGKTDGAKADGAKAEPGEPKPFAEVIKGATEHKGYFTLWEKEGKVWIEVPEERLDKPFFFEVNVSNSLGERGLYGSTMGAATMAVFRRIGNTMQLIARNANFTAAAGSPAERAVHQSFADSLIASAPVASKREAMRDTVLVEAGPLLLRDVIGYTTNLEASFRLTYALDPANSSFASLRADESIDVLSVQAHYSTPRVPGFLAPENKYPPRLPRTVPDPRSFFVGFVYSFMPLPAEPMHARRADDRVGYFQTDVADYSDDVAPEAWVHHIARWRLEKKDPAADLSEPKRPITFWIDRNVPQRYRQTITDGILEWNKAFERIGLRDAIVVKVQPDDADFDTLDAAHASVRWFLGVDAGFARGPSVVDPRSGEILDADIQISDAFTRLARQLASEELPPRPALPWGAGDWARHECTLEAQAADELGFGIELLAARAQIAPDGPEAERLARAYLKHVVMHEVGHTLGLRHNFRASMSRALSQLDDAGFTRTHGLAASVMDYLPVNIAPLDRAQGEYFMDTLGAYDYWAIEYGYRPIDPAQEKATLAQIAARGIEPELAFATDEDAHSGADPEVNLFDLSSEPLAYYERRFALSRELWERTQARALKPGEDYLVLRRNLERGFRQVERAGPLVAKYVGGVHTTRDHAGTGRALAEPVAAADQRRALALLARELFSAASFRFEPRFLGRVGIDYLDREVPEATVTERFDLAARVLKIQTEVLDHLLSEDVAARLLGAQTVAENPGRLLTLAQVYQALDGAIWSELDSGADIPRLRRNLQNERLKHLLVALLKPAAGAQADIYSQNRASAVALRERAQRALARQGLSTEARMHVQQAVALIDDALKATPVKSGL